MKKINLVVLFVLSFLYGTAQQFKLTLNETVANTGYEYLGDCDLTVNKYQQVSGTIKWSIVKIDRSAMNFYKGKMGATAVEYVAGNYNPSTKTFSFAGNRKDDPYGVYALDNYQIRLLDNMRIQGKTRGTGVWDGIINGKYSGTNIPENNVLAGVSSAPASRPGENLNAGTETKRYYDLLDQYLFHALKGNWNPEYVPGSLKDIKFISRAKNGKPLVVRGEFSYKGFRNAVWTTTVDVLFEDELAYYMIYGEKDWKHSIPFDVASRPEADKKRIAAFQQRYDDVGNSKLATINKKNYQETVQFFKTKFPPSTDAKKYLVFTRYTEKTPNRKEKAPVSVYDGRGNVTMDMVEQEKEGKYVTTSGYKNTSSKTVILKGLQRDLHSDGIWYYKNISVRIKPGEFFEIDPIQEFYNPGNAESSMIYFFNIK